MNGLKNGGFLAHYSLMENADEAAIGLTFPFYTVQTEVSSWLEVDEFNPCSPRPVLTLISIDRRNPL